MKYLIYIISSIVLAVAIVGMVYHAFYRALEIAFDVSSVTNNGIVVAGCLVLGIISALISDKRED